MGSKVLGFGVVSQAQNLGVVTTRLSTSCRLRTSGTLNATDRYTNLQLSSKIIEKPKTPL